MALDVAISTAVTDSTKGLSSLVSDRVASRIFAHDASLWGEAAAEEAAIRLGWTDVWDAAARLLPEISALREEFAAQGVDRVVLCGMGGSSLAPAVITSWAGVDLTMIDSTHPAVVRRALAGDLQRTVVVVSSKSGGTIETRSHLASFADAFRNAGIDPAGRIVIVTDPGSPLEADSRATGYRVFTADPNVGGRFSALTAFGLVPSGLAGADLSQLLADAEAVRELLAEDAETNPALRLAAAIDAGLPRRSVLAVTETGSARWGLGHWIEQLVAESTGKDGVGVLPIALDADAPELSRVPESTVVVAVANDGESVAREGAAEAAIAVAGTLGAQVLTWEVATAALGRLMGIDPFNQPDVESAKVAARSALDADGADSGDSGELVPTLAGARVIAEPRGAGITDAAQLVAQVRSASETAGYVSIQAYLDPQGDEAVPLARLRAALAELLGRPVALGWGPGYLHSTGQLHKGGPAAAAFLQLTQADPDPLPIPGSERGFDALITAQARGDRSVLAERGRPVFALASPNPAATVEAILGAIDASEQG